MKVVSGCSGAAALTWSSIGPHVWDWQNAGVAKTVGEFGGVDVLVSNAGIQIVHPIEEFTYAEWKKIQRPYTKPYDSKD